MLTDRGPRMVQGEGAEVTAAIDLFVKDSGMVAAAADAAGLPTPLLAAAREVFERAADAGLGHADDSQVIQIYREAR
jgi:3-hydroxyisobutyrate dehydrogenase-like beta-hydroxyacid dehydrogenase